MATGDFNAEFPGINDFPESERPTDVNLIYQCYHMMLLLFGVVALALILSLLVAFGKLSVEKRKWPLYLMMVGWAAALLAIQFGWCTAEFGRQPWIVYGELLTADGISQAVSAPQIIITLALFGLVYTVIYVVWAKSFIKTVKAGPEAIAAQDEAAARPVKLDVEVKE